MSKMTERLEAGDYILVKYDNHQGRFIAELKNGSGEVTNKVQANSITAVVWFLMEKVENDGKDETRCDSYKSSEDSGKSSEKMLEPIE